MEVQRDTLGVLVSSLLTCSDNIFELTCVSATAGCGRTLFSLQVVCLWEYHLAACRFVLYPLSPELPVARALLPARLSLTTLFGCGSASLARSVIDSVRFCSAMSHARVTLCCPL